MCGARSSRWTPANWVPRARSSRNVNSGGRLGSGKLVLLNGSVSSKNCTRQASVAMMHPCPVGRGPQGQRAAQASAPGLCGGGEAAATAAASRLAGSQATARPAAARTPATGGGAGAGLRPLLLPLPLGLLPCSVYWAPDRASPTFATAAGTGNARATCAASAALSLAASYAQERPCAELSARVPPRFQMHQPWSAGTRLGTGQSSDDVPPGTGNSITLLR